MIDPESWLNTLCENDQVPTQVTNIKNSMFNTVRSRIGIKTSETAAKRYGVATLSWGGVIAIFGGEIAIFDLS